MALNKQRFLSLDSLRGLAILLMVLSGSIAFGGVLPAWMYHAQVPPPQHIFKPEIAGITWVDWVFPFFLFSMGVAFPIALNKKVEKQNIVELLLSVFKRYVLLVYFAIFTYHARAWVIGSANGLKENLISICCFGLLFFMFYKVVSVNKTTSIVLQGISLLIGVVFLVIYPFNYGNLDLLKSDIIIIVLANMAFFGSLVWIITRNIPCLRVAILPFIMGFFLSGKVDGSWTQQVFTWTPIPWAYTFYYLKYLFIIIPGTFVGDWILLLKPSDKQDLNSSKYTLLLAFLCLLLVFFNTTFLFSRYLISNILLTIIISATVILLVKQTKISMWYTNIIYLGIFLLLLGLVFEPFEGGIKKDHSTYSYYFVCAGMAILVLFSIMLFEAKLYFNGILKVLAQIGQNPMIAYTAGNLFILPLLRIFNLETNFNLLNSNPLTGFLKGVIFTGLVGLLTLICTRKRIFWKT